MTAREIANEHLRFLTTPRSKRIGTAMVVQAVSTAGIVFAGHLEFTFFVIIFAGIHGWFLGKMLTELHRFYIYNREGSKVLREMEKCLEKMRQAHNQDDHWAFNLHLKRFQQLKAAIIHWENLAGDVDGSDSA